MRLYKLLGYINLFSGLIAVFRALQIAFFLNASYALAVARYSELYELERTYSNLRFFLLLTLGLCGIFFGYKTVEIKPMKEPPVKIKIPFMTVSILLDVVVLIGVISGIDFKV